MALYEVYELASSQLREPAQNVPLFRALSTAFLAALLAAQWTISYLTVTCAQVSKWKWNLERSRLVCEYTGIPSAGPHAYDSA
jgi:hypothetical protein